MELLVVIGIIIVIAASVLTVIPGIHENTQKKATKAFMDRLEIAIEQYYDDNRRYPTGTEPTEIENLKKALQPSDPASKQYIEFADEELDNIIIIDEWGNPFVFISSTDATPNNNTTTYYLYSTGPDGTTSSSGDDADDINNWSR